MLVALRGRELQEGDKGRDAQEGDDGEHDFKVEVVLSEEDDYLKEEAGDGAELLVDWEGLGPALELAGADDVEPPLDVEQEEPPEQGWN